jgi:hypothetical protein
MIEIQFIISIKGGLLRQEKSNFKKNQSPATKLLTSPGRNAGAVLYIKLQDTCCRKYILV